MTVKDLELVFILDKSGSMSGLEKDTIGGFNTMLEKQKGIEGNCIVTTVLFDHQYQLLHDRVNIKDLEPITEKDYYVGGMTALLDAMGKTINILYREVNEEERNVMFVIITDGEENSSVEYSLEKVKKLVESKKENGWEFIFMGANIDAIKTADLYGIDKDRASNFIADEDGVNLNYEVMGEVVSNYRRDSKISDNWKDKIEEDLKRK